MDSSSSSLPFRFPKQWKYEVFLSFVGGDTLDYFTSYLHSVLHENSVVTFVDEKLRRGDEMTSELSQVIEESKIALIIFSKDYASSSLCLDELVKIIECNETHGQIVVPVFYHVDPVEVENQLGSFGAAFPNMRYHFDRVKRWKAALSKVGKLAGWDSKITRLEEWLAYYIVEDILKKLNQECQRDSEFLVGVSPRIDEIMKLLSDESKDVRILGIWGMGGIGKTTLAKAVFRKIACQFERCCFLENVKGTCANNGSNYLVKELLSQISGENGVRISTSTILRPNLVRKLICKKVLIVMDDVNNPQQFEFFEKNLNFFGKGSRILVTSRDKQTLSSSVDDVYEVKELSGFDAYVLFRQNALKKSTLVKDHSRLSSLFIKYANRNPLALKVLGSFLSGKSLTDWESVLEKLEKAPMKGIEDVLRISFDDLDEDEKDIFLHVACFFRGDSREEVARILKSCGFNVDIGLRVLMDKSLVTLSEWGVRNSTLEMHDLLQEMGKEIVREESMEPGKRSRLWDHEEIVRMLTKNTGTDQIEAIFLDMSKIEVIDLKPDVFMRMTHLKLLKFFYGFQTIKEVKVLLSQGLECLPKELRYLYWHGYPLETLPPNLDEVKIVELHLPCSKLKVPPRGDMIKRLQFLDLHHSNCITKVPELTLASNLVALKVSGCERIKTFPSTIGLISLESLDLSGLLELQMFPEISRNIKFLNLSDTAIKEVPATVESLGRLVQLCMNNCNQLESVPSSIGGLKSLEVLELSGCSNLQEFPEISEIMDHFWSLSLEGTKITGLPSSIENMKCLESLNLQNCRNLSHLPESLGNLKSFSELHLQNCRSLTHLPETLGNLESFRRLDLQNCKNLSHLPESLCNLKSLSSIELSGCQKLEKMPANLTVSMSLKARQCHLLGSLSDLSSLSSISKLDLSGNRFETLPASIEQLSDLWELDISFCSQLKSLPCLPMSLMYLNAHECRSLATVSSPLPWFEFGNDVSSYIEEKTFLLTNCFKLDPNNSWGMALSALEGRLQRSMSLLNKSDIEYDTRRMMMYPGNEIPEWFTYTSEGNSIHIPFCRHADERSFCWDKAAVSFVIAFPDNYCIKPHEDFDIECYLNSHDQKIFSLRASKSIFVMSEHVALCYPIVAPRPRRNYGIEDFAWLEISLHGEGYGLKVTKCGIRPLCTCVHNCTIPLKDDSIFSENEKLPNSKWKHELLSGNLNFTEREKEEEEPPFKRSKQG